MNRLKIKIRKNSIDKGIEILTFILILISALLIGIYYSRLPEKLPIYFNWPSKDKFGFGTKDLLWASPIISGIIGIALFNLNKYLWILNYPTEIKVKNAEYNYRISTQMLRILGLIIGFMCLSLTMASILNGLGNNTEFGSYLFPLFPILLTGLPIFYMIKILRN